MCLNPLSHETPSNLALLWILAFETPSIHFPFPFYNDISILLCLSPFRFRQCDPREADSNIISRNG